ncbi:MAG: hypothetical protein L0Y71_11320 [Gemmataceae bacterium]|nr:hypothetical protein [Gemmataceae bacterium]
MSFPRRIVWPTMALTLVALTLVALAASPARAVDPKLLPGDTELLLSLNVKQILDSPLAKQYKELIDQARGALEGQIQNNPAAKYLDKAGLDLFRDVHSVAAASNGSKEQEAIFIVVDGTFNPAKIVATAQEIARDNAEVLKVTKLGNVDVFEITPPGDKRMYAALINDKTLVACATHAALKDAVNGSARKMKEGFKSLLKTTSAKQSFSFVATGSALAKLIQDAPVPNAEMAVAMFQDLDGLSIAITLNKDIQFQIGMNCKDEETTKKAVAMGNFGLLTVRTLAAQKAKEKAELQPLVDVAKTLRITSEGNNVVLRGDISLENLEKLIKVIPNNFNR